MKKLLTFSILTYLLFTINSSAVSQNSNGNNPENEKVLKIGVLVPLSGKFQDIGQSFLKAIQLALYDISNENIKIYPKDSKGNALNTYQSAKEFEEQGIKELIRSRGLQSQVHLVAPQPHHILSTFYRASDFVLVPSRSESFGLVALEAAACGAPVIAASVAKRRHLILDIAGSRTPAARLLRIRPVVKSNPVNF